MSDAILRALAAAAGKAAAQGGESANEYLADLTAQARSGKLAPVVGREDELVQVLEVLGQGRKANAVLIGAAGVGKTAIAEGLARLTAMSGNAVPEHLRGLRVLALDVAALTAGSGVVGELEKRVRSLFDSLAGQRVVLFIDELHTLVGMGGRERGNDLAQLIKPYLARGDFRVLAATTSAEYDQIVAADAALERRFAPIFVPALTPAAAVEALAAHARYMGVAVGKGVLKDLVHRVAALHRGRSLPDSAVDVLERAHSMARLERSPLARRHVRRALYRALRLPVDVECRLARLARRAPSPLLQDAAGRVLDVLRGKGTGPVVTAGGSAQQALEAAGGLAAALGAEIIDLNADRDESEIYGARPGLVGYQDRRPIHRLAELPFAVLLLRQCGEAPANLLAEMRRGVLEDTRGRRLPVNVVVTSDGTSARSIGFSMS
jgi:hypothetical protein